MTLDDLEWLVRTLLHYTRVLRSHHASLNEDRSTKPMTLSFFQYKVYADIHGVPWRGGARAVKTVTFTHSTGWNFEIFGDNRTIVVWLYVVPHWLSTDPEIDDLEWPWMTLNGHLTDYNKMHSSRAVCHASCFIVSSLTFSFIHVAYRLRSALEGR